MLEMCLFGNKVDSSSPGPASLIGSYSNGTEGNIAGYYGTTNTTTDGLPTTAELQSLLSIRTAVVVTANPTWLKFILDGKILYYPSSDLLSNISYNTLKSYGVVSPSSNTVITHKGHKYRVYLIKAATGDTSPGGTIAPDSQWGRLMFPIASTTVAADTQGKAKWARVNLNVVEFILAMELYAPDKTKSTGPYQDVKTSSYGVASSPDGNRRWRPVLEWLGSV